MGYKIEQIEGIGAAYAEKLQAAGINTTEALLEKCAGKKIRYHHNCYVQEISMMWKMEEQR